jgi:asparagine synthase (glutamine-hydrolysing)
MSLKRADGLGMAHSLELRVPFLDRPVVELAGRIPSSFMVRRGVEKYVLRRALAPYLPDTITWRRKRPFQVRLASGLDNALEFLCDALLRSEDVRDRGFFDPARVDALRRARPGRHTLPMAHNLWAWRVWSMVMCEAWARMFLDRPIANEPPLTFAELTSPAGLVAAGTA